MSLSVERSFHLVARGRRRGGAQVEIRRGPAPPEPEPEEAAQPRIPRISRLMALAIHFQDLLDRGVVEDASTLARLAHVSQPRMTQILNLNLLAPDIQEALLFLNQPSEGEPTIGEREVRRLSGALSWVGQRNQVKTLFGHAQGR